jgi:hypothetical protein
MDLERAEAVPGAKHGRAVTVEMWIKKYERLKALEGALQSPKKPRTSPARPKAAAE